MTHRIIALGQAAAGDDGAGLAVLDELRRRGLGDSPDVELIGARDATALVELLDAPGEVVIVDAALGPPAGTVLELGDGDLAERGVDPVSTHGMRLSEILGLARALSSAAPGASPSIRVVAIAIERPAALREGLSPEVAAAVTRAADVVAGLVSVRLVSVRTERGRPRGRRGRAG